MGAAAEGGADSGDVAGGVARDSGHYAGGDADVPAVAELEGVPDVVDEFADLAGYCGLQGGGNSNGFCGQEAHGLPYPAEFLQCGLAVNALALVFSELFRVPVSGMFEQAIDVGAAGEVTDCAVEQLADVVDRPVRIRHYRHLHSASV